MHYRVYIIYTATGDQYYVGFTGDEMEERLRKHNNKHSGFTGRFKDWKLVHIEKFDTKESACAREREIKAWKSKVRIKQLFNSSEHSV